MPNNTLDTATLSNVVKLIGVVVSWGGSIYFLWVKKPPPILANDHFFDQVRRISIVVISIFLLLTWGLLAKPESLPVLAWISVAATGIGIAVFFWIVNTLRFYSQRQTPWNTTWALFGFMAYTTLISWGLTAAVEFIAVFLLNPANAQTGTSLVPSKRYAAVLQIAGEATVQTNEDKPFRSSSGQRNFGCNDTISAEVRYSIPVGASLLSPPTGSWENTNNVRATSPVQIRNENGTVVASSSITGLGFQEFGLGIRNCPGGGHGELVVSGTYRSSVSKREPKQLTTTNTFTLAGQDPVWMTVPQPTELNLRQVVANLTELDSKNGQSETLTVTPEAPTAEGQVHKVTLKLEVEKGRIGVFNAN